MVRRGGGRCLSQEGPIGLCLVTGWEEGDHGSSPEEMNPSSFRECRGDSWRPGIPGEGNQGTEMGKPRKRSSSLPHPTQDLGNSKLY